MNKMRDQFGRTIDYMRVSITDRCNLRCIYCMPNDVDPAPVNAVMTYEEIRDICAAAAELGIHKIKITGGEPLVRPGCASFIAMLKQTPGIEQVTMTTNGVLLKENLPDLLAAGLDAVNISLDTLDEKRYEAITGRPELNKVQDSIAAALASGLKTKINTVLQKGLNEDEWLHLAGLAKDRCLDVRFIELMPIGCARDSKGISNETLRTQLVRRFSDTKNDLEIHGNGPAVYVHIPGWMGSIGFISAIHGKFCGSCNRIRLTARGKLKPCLCYGETIDLLPFLREGRKEELFKALRTGIFGKPAGHCFETPENMTETASMNSIGG